MIVQELSRVITGAPIYEHQAIAILERAEANATILRKLARIEPQWVHDYCAAQEWHVHKDRSHWQMTAPKGRFKRYACFSLKMEKKAVTAAKMWNAVEQIAEHYKVSMNDVIKELMSYSNVIEQLASLGEE
jgi:hypothetical protein